MSEEIGKYDPYTDKFIKNTTTGTTTDRIEIGTDGIPYILSVSNSSGLYARSLKELDECDFIDKSTKLYTKDEVMTMLEEIKDEANNIRPTIYNCASFSEGIRAYNNLVQQKINKLKG